MPEDNVFIIFFVEKKKKTSIILLLVHAMLLCIFLCMSPSVYVEESPQDIQLRMVYVGHKMWVIYFNRKC